MQIAHLRRYDRVKLYFKFNGTTGFVCRLCFCNVAALGSVKPAWGVRTRLLIRTWPGPAPVGPFFYTLIPKIQTRVVRNNSLISPVRASCGSGSFKQIFRGVKQRNCWKFPPNSWGKFYSEFGGKIPLNTPTWAFLLLHSELFFSAMKEHLYHHQWGFSVKTPLDKDGIEPPCCCKYCKCSCLGFS